VLDEVGSIKEHKREDSVNPEYLAAIDRDLPSVPNKRLSMISRAPKRARITACIVLAVLLVLVIGLAVGLSHKKDPHVAHGGKLTAHIARSKLI
jgi:hypothetical protein